MAPPKPTKTKREKVVTTVASPPPHGRSAALEEAAVAAESEGLTVTRATREDTEVVTRAELPPHPPVERAHESIHLEAHPVPVLIECIPDDIAHLLDLWRLRTATLTRVEHVEIEGPRRTWTLWENGTQTGHVRGRNIAAESWERAARELEVSGAPELLVRQDEHIAERCMDPTDEKWSSPWTWEAAGSGRAALGLPTAPTAPTEGGDA